MAKIVEHNFTEVSNTCSMVEMTGIGPKHLTGKKGSTIAKEIDNAIHDWCHLQGDDDEEPSIKAVLYNTTLTNPHVKKLLSAGFTKAGEWKSNERLGSKVTSLIKVLDHGKI